MFGYSIANINLSIISEWILIQDYLAHSTKLEDSSYGLSSRL